MRFNAWASLNLFLATSFAWGSEGGASMRSLTDGHPMPSFKMLFIKLGVVVLLAILAVLGLRKLKTSADKPGIVGSIARQMNTHLNRVTQGAFQVDSLIQPVSSYKLDAKRSLVVVRVAGRLVILGLSGDSMNLITQFEDTGSSEFTKDFSSVLETEGFKPRSTSQDSGYFSSAAIAATAPGVTPGSDSLVPNARTRIRERMEGLKPL